LNGLRQALTLAISEAFFIGFFVILGALVITFFLKEIPLRTQHDHKTTINGDLNKS